MKKKILIVLMLFIGSIAATGQTIIYVDKDATGAEDGTSWTDAFTGIQAAINSIPDGDVGTGDQENYEIWVAKGIYIPTTDGYGNEYFEGRDAFPDAHFVTIFGGFYGDETAVSQRDYQSNKTIISGDVDGDDVTDSEGITVDFADIRGVDNRQHLFKIYAQDVAYVTLDGLTLTAGRANALSGDERNGGAIFVSSTGQLTVKNCDFYGNLAAHTGGAIKYSVVYDMEVINCKFFNNRAQVGGGAIDAGSSAANIDLIIDRCTFAYNKVGNNATSSGGAIDNGGADAMHVSNSLFYGGEGRLGGAFSISSNSTNTFTNCTFSNNENVSYNFNSAANTYFNNCVIYDNPGAGVGTNIGNVSISNGTYYAQNTLWEGSGGSASWTSESNVNDNGGNIDVDPQFIDEGSNNFILGATSQALNSGNNSLLISGYSSFDVSGNSRILSSNVDMGAYEGSNDAPIDITLSSNSFEVENARYEVVGVFSTEDPNASNTHTYSLVSGTGSGGNGLFRIVGAKLQVDEEFVSGDEVYSPLDIRVRTTDNFGAFYEEQFEIHMYPDGEIVHIPDPNFKSYLLGRAVINTTDDEEITYTEASAFSGFLYVEDLGINSLEGIEAFVNITDLDAGKNNFITVDLSSNTQLDFVILDDGNLQSLDVSMLSALVNLWVDNNELVTLDVSNNSLLEELRAGSNQLTELNLTNGNNSSFTKMSATNNPNLYCVLVDDVSVAQNNTTWYIPVQSFYSTDCSNVEPTEISLSTTSINEENSLGDLVGTLTTTDADAGDLHTYSLVAGVGDDDNGSFMVDDNRLEAAEVFDASVKDTYFIRLETSDNKGGFFEKKFTITVNFLDNTPPSIDSWSPTKDATNVALDANFVIVYSEPVFFGTNTNNSVVLSATSGEDAIYFDTDNGAEVIINDNEVTFNPPSNFLAGRTYRFAANSGYLVDSAGNPAPSVAFNINQRFSTVPITWDGTAWNNTTGPTASDDVSIEGAYTGGFECADLTISNEPLTVDAGSTLIVNGDITNNNSLIVESGASLITFEGNTLTGNNIFIERNTRYSDGKYSFVGTPLEQDATNTGADLGSYVYQYDESVSANADDLARWVDASSDELVPGQGYTQANQKRIDFFGIPNDGTISYTASMDNDGYHLVSNPYPAAIHVDDFIDGNADITGTVYIWDDNGSDTGRGSNSDYLVVTKTAAQDNNGPDNEARWNDYIGAMQGFFVQMDGSAGTVTFTESMRVSGSNADGNFFRSNNAPKPVVRVNLTNEEGLFKQAVIGWNEAVSDTELAKGYDGKVFSTSGADMLYTMKGEHALAIQTITSQKERIPLTYHVEEAGVYTLQPDLQESQGHSLYLRDKLTEETTDLSRESYSFNTASGQFSDRFELLTSARVLGLDEDKVQIYAHEKTIHINMPDGPIRMFELMSINGQRIMSRKLDRSAQIQTNLPAGVYIITDGEQSHKVILK